MYCPGMNKKHTLPRQIKHERLALGMSKEAFARAVGVNARTVFRWEDGTSSPSLKNAVALRTLFDARSMVGGRR